MESKVDIWMPLAIGDYLADTSHLDTLQHGAYLLLLMHYWRKGPLPNDPAKLANIAKLSKDAWSMNQAVLMEFFTLAQDGLLHQKRSDREKEKWMKTRTTAQSKASKAAQARWAVGAPTDRSTSVGSVNAPSNAPGNTQAKLKPCPLPKPLPIPEPEPELPESAKNADSSANDLFGETATSNGKELNAALGEVFAYYLQVMRRNRATYTFSALRRKKGMARLQEAVRMAHGNLAGAAELMKAVVDEVAQSDFHMGREPKTGGQSYCEWEDHLFRSTEQFEKWVQRYQEAVAREQ